MYIARGVTVKKDVINFCSDVGEGFGVYKYGYDEELIPLLSSASIACGFHAGDPLIMIKTLEMAKQSNVVAGAHPGLLDLRGFGRRPIKAKSEEIAADVIYQIGAIKSLAKIVGIEVPFVKVHGALQRMTAEDEKLAKHVADHIYKYDPELKVMAIWNSKLLICAENLGLQVLREILVDRGYDDDGKILPLTHPKGEINDEDIILSRIDQLIIEQKIFSSVNNKEIPVTFDTLGFHADTTNLEVVKKIRDRLIQLEVKIRY